MNGVLAVLIGLGFAAAIYAAIFYRPPARTTKKPPLVPQEPAVGARFNNLTSAPYPKPKHDVATNRDTSEG